MQPNSRLQRIYVLPCALSQTILFREIKFYDLNDFWKLIYERCNINMASPLVPVLLGHWSSHWAGFLWHWSVHWRLRIWLCLRITQENQWKTQLPGPHSRTTGWEDLGARPTNAYFQKNLSKGFFYNQPTNWHFGALIYFIETQFWGREQGGREEGLEWIRMDSRSNSFPVTRNKPQKCCKVIQHLFKRPRYLSQAQLWSAPCKLRAGFF